MSESVWGFLRPERNKSRTEAHSTLLESEVRVVGESTEDVQVILHAEDQQIALNEYVPEGTKFRVEGMRFLCGINGSNSEADFTVILPERGLNEFGIDSLHGRLSLLHEMGHTINRTFSEMPKMNKAVEIRAENILQQMRADYRKTTFKFGIDESSPRWKAFIEKEFPERWTREETAPVDSELNPTYDNLLSFLRLLAKNERDAWANALRIQRRIKSEKEVDILEGASKDEIFEFIYDRALGSYEDKYGFLFSQTERKSELKTLENDKDS